MEIGAPEGEWLGAGDERRPKAKSEKVRRGEKLKSLRTRLFFAFFFANTKTFSLSLSARSLLFAVSVEEFFFHREILRFIFHAVTRIFVDVFFFCREQEKRSGKRTREENVGEKKRPKMPPQSAARGWNSRVCLRAFVETATFFWAKVSS